MSRITKELAKEIAINLTDGKKKTIKQINEEINNIIIEKYNKSLPIEIFEFSQKGNKKWLRYAYSFHLRGQGVEKNYYNLGVALPSKCDYPVIEFDKTEANKMEKLFTKLDSLNKEYKNLIQEIEATLFDLRTFKRAIEFLPECAEFLPSENKTFLPQINIEKLRERLK